MSVLLFAIINTLTFAKLKDLFRYHFVTKPFCFQVESQSSNILELAQRSDAVRCFSIYRLFLSHSRHQSLYLVHSRLLMLSSNGECLQGNARSEIWEKMLLIPVLVLKEPFGSFNHPIRHDIICFCLVRSVCNMKFVKQYRMLSLFRSSMLLTYCKNKIVDILFLLDSILI